jgi:hypothetical protein
MSSLEELDLNTNEISGELPGEIGDLTELKELILFGNIMNGTLATEIGQLTGLEILLLNNNAFDGAIPSELGKLADADLIQLDMNKFCELTFHYLLRCVCTLSGTHYAFFLYEPQLERYHQALDH